MDDTHEPATDLAARRVFLSSGIPEHDWSDAPFQRHEITQAVVAVARTVLMANGCLLFGGHPLITPLVFDVAGEIVDRQDNRSDRVVLFQSTYFADALPAAVWDFRRAAWASVHDVSRSVGPGNQLEPSLLRMREAMLGSQPPIAAAVFIGGKAGIADEYRLVRDRFPGAPLYPLRRPGGAAADLEPVATGPTIAEELATSAAYFALARRLVADIAERAG